MPLILNGTTGISGVDGSAGTPSYQGGDTNTGVFFPAADVIAFTTNGTEDMRIDSSGNVGIGASSTGYKLQVSGTLGVESTGNNVVAGLATLFEESANRTRRNRLEIGGDASGQFINATWSSGGTTAMRFQTDGTERMRITSGGNVGIGTSSPSSNLVVNSSTATQFDLLTNGTRYFSAYTDASQVILGGIQNTIVSFRQNDVERMQLDTSGNLRFNSGYGSVATAYGCRAWVTFNGTGTIAIRASGNISSLVDYGTGDYGVLFSTSMPDGNYSLVGAAVKTGGGPSGTNSAVVTMGESPSTAGTGVGVLTVDGTAVDRAYVYAAFFR